MRLAQALVGIVDLRAEIAGIPAARVGVVDAPLQDRLGGFRRVRNTVAQ